MAKFYPDFKEISELKVPPTEGELHLLKYLGENLDDSFEVYFQPMLDGDRPDIVIMKKHAGVIIIEVKDWNLNAYAVKKENNGQITWRVNQSRTEIHSPIAQVKKYKKHIYEFHLEGVYEKATTYSRGENYYSFVNCCVYFHESNETEVTDLVNIYDNKFIGIFSRDRLDDQFKSFVHSTSIDEYSKERPSHYFTDQYYNQLKKMLQPSFHELNIGKTYHYTKKQYELIRSEPENKKIKGASGSGKSTVLAQRAVNSHRRGAGNAGRTNDEILILTYNITLINFLKDKINNVRNEIPRNKFYIDNFHNFMTKTCNNIGMQSPWIMENDVLVLKPTIEQELTDLQSQITPYPAVFMDEIQDFPREWQRIIKEYFLVPGGELVLFGDEKQNIYGNELEEQKIATIIPGRWNELNETHRLTFKLTDIALSYQQEFFVNKYTIDPIEVKSDSYEQLALDVSDEGIFKYYYYDSEAEFISQYTTEQVFAEFNKSRYSHPNDIAILSPEKEILRELDFRIHKNKNLGTAITFANKAIFDKLVEKHIKICGDRQCAIQSKGFKEELRKIERSKKLHFRMNPGTLKLSTIHSFKGWEIYNLVLIISSSNNAGTENTSIDELVYTGLTRCRKNLIVINIGNDRYHNFFQSQTR